RDRSVDVVIALVRNPRVEMDIVEALAFHKRPEIRTAAGERLDSGVSFGSAAADSTVPELRERVEAFDASRVYDFATGRPVELHFEPEPAPQPERPPAPTRTAPIRGFRIEQAG